MSTKAFKYFHSGDQFSKAIGFVEDNISPFVEPGGEPINDTDEIWVINKRIRITIEIYEDE